MSCALKRSSVLRKKSVLSKSLISAGRFSLLLIFLPHIFPQDLLYLSCFLPADPVRTRAYSAGRILPRIFLMDSGSTGFAIYPSIPALRAFSISSSNALAVMAMIGISACSLS